MSPPLLEARRRRSGRTGLRRFGRSVRGHGRRCPSRRFGHVSRHVSRRVGGAPGFDVSERFRSGLARGSRGENPGSFVLQVLEFAMLDDPRTLKVGKSIHIYI